MSKDAKSTVTLRLYAAAQAAAGNSEIMVQPGSLEAILNSISHDNARLRQVFAQCAFLVDGVAAHEKEIDIPSGSTVDVLPPFAGG